MEQIRDQSPMAMAITLLKAVGDDRGKYETLMGYIDGLNAGIRIAKSDVGKTAEDKD